MTLDLSQLSVDASYRGSDHLQVGNSEDFPISYPDHTISPSYFYSKALHLNNVLGIPHQELS